MEPFHSIAPNHFSLPRRISQLGDLAYNMWWTWHPDAKRLYMRIDPELWEQVGHNPVQFLRNVERSRLNSVTNNRYYLDFYDRMVKAFDQYMTRTDTWCQQQHPEICNQVIAYFSMEYGLHQSVPLYAGGSWYPFYKCY